jgi:hypothetical protein
MAANLIGTVGIWGLTSEATNGIIIESIEETNRNEKNYIKNHVGERTGRSDYDQSITIRLSGKLTSSGGFSQKLGAALTMANSVPNTSLHGSISGGMTLIDEIKRSPAAEDWHGIEVDAEFLPYFAAPGG